MTTAQIRSIAASFHWMELESRFKEIQAKPSVREMLRSEFTRTEWDSGLATEEWSIRGNAVCRTEFERLATIAARKLGYEANEDSFKYWLERVREWMRRTGLDKSTDLTWCPTGEGWENGSFYKTSHMSTERIAELSALFCVELMAHGAPESALSASPEQPEGGGRKPMRGSSFQKSPKTKAQAHKTSVIFGAIQSGLKARKYCGALDDRRVPLPIQWTDEECPSTYSQAYKDAKWRKRIQDEQSRYREEYESTSVQERETIIQGVSGTRRTRR